ncbi:hypothetical protein [Bacillus suaedaesalsae]|uniref:Uncharacterized protein n=1 Tax=Bacillus suaedaesalsae TaxID=2810349 RepID=A0ABS2DLM2_9BACI|nr:hypothetical protein [Bacillus suaedaesalsae]MBM6619384.1 hypothetical protein [Bacillus suaedaesalsae]
MEKTYHYSYEANNQINNSTIEDISIFDDVMETVTNNMFKVILFGGIPFFLWIVVQAFIKF